MAKIKNIRDHKITSSDIYFFDCNIWIFLFASIGGVGKDKQQAYSNMLREIQTVNASVFISSLVISEFANRCLRHSFELWKKSQSYNVEYKKDYISTQDYKESALIVKSNILSIEEIALKRPDDFNSVNTSKILENIQRVDYNDSYYANYCDINKLKIVTDDKDFEKLDYANLEIITFMR